MADHFVRVSDRILGSAEFAKLSALQIRVWLALLLRNNGLGQASMSAAELTQACHAYSRSSIQLAVRGLESAGWLVRQPQTVDRTGAYRPRRYRVTCPVAGGLGTFGLGGA